jgi:hypothetical protein
MNIFARLSSVLILLALVINFVACGPDPEPDPIDEVPTEEEKVTTLLTSGTGTWAASGSGITVDGDDVTADLFSGFNIKFEDGKLTTAGTTPVWPRQDTWEFKDETAKVIIRHSDNKEIQITSVSETQLKLTLEWDKTTYEEGGRKRSIPGTYVFTLNK